MRLISWFTGLVLLLVGFMTHAAPPRPETAAEIEEALSVQNDAQTDLKLRGGPSVGAVRGLGGIVRDPAKPTKETSQETARTDPHPSVDIANYTALVRNRPKTMALIHFDTDSARIRSDAYPLLNEYAAALQGAKLAEAVLLVAGHTDSVGSDRYNLNLSQRRAQAVKEYLITRGVLASRLIAKGYGETHPIADNAIASGRDLNRRSEFIRMDGSLANN